MLAVAAEDRFSFFCTVKAVTAHSVMFETIQILTWFVNDFRDIQNLFLLEIQQFPVLVSWKLSIIMKCVFQ